MKINQIEELGEEVPNSKSAGRIFRMLGLTTSLLLAACGHKSDEPPRGVNSTQSVEQPQVTLEQAKTILARAEQNLNYYKQVKPEDNKADYSRDNDIRLQPAYVEYIVDERAISFVTTFDVTRNGAPAGKVAREVLNFLRTYKYNDPDGNCLAEAQVGIRIMANHFEVTDCRGNSLAKVKEDVVKSFFGGGFKTSYDIYRDGGHVATSEKTNFAGTDLRVRAGGDLIMHAERPYFNMGGDRWTLRIPNGEEVVDERVWVLMVALKTDADNLREEEEEKKKKEEEEEKRRNGSGW